MKDLYLSLTKKYMMLNESDNALDCLEKAADFAITFDTLPDIFIHTSIISSGDKFSKAKNLAKDYDYNDSYQMLHNYLSDSKYDPICETARFAAVVPAARAVRKNGIITICGDNEFPSWEGCRRRRRGGFTARRGGFTALAHTVYTTGSAKSNR